jgi:cytochrome c biogenesis protein CcmG, thiol:disulfide interchange protein DsbE
VTLLVRRIAAGLGLCVIALPLWVGGLDVRHAARNWDRLGPLPPGREAPPFAVRMLDGGVFDHPQLAGEVTLVTFWATWCPACRSELADLDEVDEDLERRGVRFVAVNREGGQATPAMAAEIARRYRDAQRMSLPIAVDDGSMARAFRVGPIPHTVLFDRRGMVRHVHQGRVATSTLVDELEALLDE